MLLGVDYGGEMGLSPATHMHVLISATVLAPLTLAISIAPAHSTLPPAQIRLCLLE